MRSPCGAVLLMLSALAGCDYPRDAGDTLARVERERVLKVGVAERPPFVTVRGETPAGIEPKLIESIADRLDVRVQWVAASETSLVAALSERRIDILIAGLTVDSPWTEQVAATMPYRSDEIVVAAPAGDQPPTPDAGLAGRTVAYDSSRADFAALIAAAGGTPRPVAGQIAGQVDGLAAVYRFEAPALGLRPTAIVLAREEHVILVPPGENAFLLRLDRLMAHPPVETSVRLAP